MWMKNNFTVSPSSWKVLVREKLKSFLSMSMILLSTKMGRLITNWWTAVFNTIYNNIK